MKNRDKNRSLFEICNTTKRYFFIVLGIKFFIQVLPGCGADRFPG